MSAMKFKEEFTDEGGRSLRSSTADVSVAIRYAVTKDARSALLFRFVMRNNLERGADVQRLSMSPGDSKTLVPPGLLTFLQKTRSGAQVVEHSGQREERRAPAAFVDTSGGCKLCRESAVGENSDDVAGYNLRHTCYCYWHQGFE